MMTRSLPFAALRPSATLVPFGPATTSVHPGRSGDRRRRKSSTRRRTAVEMLEERTLLSGVSIPTYQTLQLGIGGPPNPVVALAPMQNTIVELGPVFGSPIPHPLSVSVQLQAGEIFTASATPSPPSSMPVGLGLRVTGPAGQKVASQVQLGLTNPSVDFVAPTTGTYTVKASPLPGNIGPVSPILTMRPIELNTGSLDPAGSATDAALFSYAGGGLYAWLNSSRTELTFSGPTGIGFEIGGHWSQSVSGSTITYTDTNSIDLHIGRDLGLPLPSGVAFTVTAQANDASNLFGQVTGENLSLQGTSLASLLSPLSILANFSFPNGGLFLPQVGVGIGLGSSSGVQATGLPVDPAVPYLYFSLSTSVNLRFGGASVVPNTAYHVGIAIDPSDPLVGIDIQGIPILSEVALEVSQNATIPYAPQAPPEQWRGVFYGDVYFKGAVDVGALTGGELPVGASASITANLDPNHTGLTETMAQNLDELLHGQMTPSAAMYYLDSISVGFNSEVDLTLPASSRLTIVLPAAEASVIYSGPTRTLYMHADSMNPFANTPIASYLPNSAASFDGSIDFATGQFQFTGEEDFSFAGLSVDAQLTLSNSGVVLAFDTALSDTASFGLLKASFAVQMTDVLSIQFASNGNLSFTLHATGSATASCEVGGRKKNMPPKSLNPLDLTESGDLATLKSATASFNQGILDDVANDVVSWMRSVEHEQWTTWDKIWNWIRHHIL
jgi:hypothetical protein